MSSSGTVPSGLKAGLIGATVLAVWFLLIDSINGQPFHTPAFLSSILFGVDGIERSIGLISVYTVIHYAAFGVLGVAFAWLMSRVETCPSLLLGVVLGFILFDGVFYGSLLITGVDVVFQLGWPEVLAGNVIAGVGLTGYLHRSMGLRSPAWVEALSRHKVVREGVVAGVLGAVIVAIWFLLMDSVRGQPFFTPGALGSAVFLRVTDAAAVEVSALTVIGYTVIHFLAFIAVGIAAVALVVQAEKAPALLLAGILILATAEAFFIGLMAVLAEWLLGELGWAAIGIGNLLAAGAMALYLWQAHPQLRAAFRMSTLAEDIPGESPAAEGGDIPPHP